LPDNYRKNAEIKRKNVKSMQFSQWCIRVFYAYFFINEIFLPIDSPFNMICNCIFNIVFRDILFFLPLMRDSFVVDPVEIRDSNPGPIDRANSTLTTRPICNMLYFSLINLYLLLQIYFYKPTITLHKTKMGYFQCFCTIIGGSVDNYLRISLL